MAAWIQEIAYQGRRTDGVADAMCFKSLVEVL